jgi:competence protein ComEA
MARSKRDDRHHLNQDYTMFKSRFAALLAALILGVGSVFAAEININTAGKQQLMSLDGIGESKAEAIMSYRESSGPFESVEDLQKVRGIGSATLQKNAGNMTVSGE